MIEDETLQRSSLMADQQDRPDEKPDATPPASAPHFSDAPPPPAEPPPPAAKKTPAKKAKAAKKAPAKTPKKTPAKAAKKAAPAKKAAKKAPAKKAPPKPPEPKIAPKPAPKLADTNGDRKLTEAVKETAAQAKSTVAAAANPVAGPRTIPLVQPDQSRLPLAAAIAAGVLAILLVLVARRHGED
jgi:hypothetical protein